LPQPWSYPPPATTGNRELPPHRSANPGPLSVFGGHRQTHGVSDHGNHQNERVERPLPLPGKWGGSPGPAAGPPRPWTYATGGQRARAAYPGPEIDPTSPSGIESVGGTFVELDDPVDRVRQGLEDPKDVDLPSPGCRHRLAVEGRSILPVQRADSRRQVRD